MGECFPYLSEVVCDEMLLIAALAPENHDTLHEGHAVDLGRAARNKRQIDEVCAAHERDGGSRGRNHAKGLCMKGRCPVERCMYARSKTIRGACFNSSVCGVSLQTPCLHIVNSRK